MHRSYSKEEVIEQISSLRDYISECEDEIKEIKEDIRGAEREIQSLMNIIY